MASTADGITIALALSLCRVDGRIWMILPRVDVTDVGVDCTWNGFSALEVLFRPGAVSFTFGTWRLEGEACIHGVTYWHTCSLIGIGLGIHFAHFIRFSWYA